MNMTYDSIVIRVHLNNNIMISSSNFFKKTLFQSEDKSLEFYSQAKKEVLTPWLAQETIPLKFISKRTDPLKSKQKSIQQRPKKQEKSCQFSSNLFPSKIPVPSQTSTTLPPLTNVSRVPYAKKQPSGQKKVKVQNCYDSISIGQFLKKQRELVVREKDNNKKYLQSLNQQIQNSYFINRGYLKNRFAEKNSKTLNHKRQIITPVQLSQRKATISFNSEQIGKQYIKSTRSTEKYRTLNQRYSQQ